jgi:hypothetical protein
MTRAALLIPLLAIAGTARAQGTSPICTDRPTKANAVCTVPPGTFQLETSAIGWTLTEAGGSRSELLTLGSSVAKVSISDRSDLQIGFTPFAELTSKGAGASDRVSGSGDILVRYKHRVTREGAPVQVAAIPFVKLPTAAAGLGNNKVEAGLAIPISFALAGSVTMTLGPEVDLLANVDGSGRHLAMVTLVNLSIPVAPRWTLIGELWTNFNFDPGGTVEQASADAAVAYGVSNNLQLDIGANVGLTADTPDLELYAGLSFKL